ncbi:hypothetical protein GGF50DRAFT_119978 [Schizophyllum commune]
MSSPLAERSLLREILPELIDEDRCTANECLSGELNPQPRNVASELYSAADVLYTNWEMGSRPLAICSARPAQGETIFIAHSTPPVSASHHRRVFPVRPRPTNPPSRSRYYILVFGGTTPAQRFFCLRWVGPLFVFAPLVAFFEGCKHWFVDGILCALVIPLLAMVVLREYNKQSGADVVGEHTRIEAALSNNCRIVHSAGLELIASWRALAAVLRTVGEASPGGRISDHHIREVKALFSAYDHQVGHSGRLDFERVRPPDVPGGYSRHRAYVEAVGRLAHVLEIFAPNDLRMRPTICLCALEYRSHASRVPSSGVYAMVFLLLRLLAFPFAHYIYVYWVPRDNFVLWFLLTIVYGFLSLDILKPLSAATIKPLAGVFCRFELSDDVVELQDSLTRLAPQEEKLTREWLGLRQSVMIESGSRLEMVLPRYLSTYSTMGETLPACSVDITAAFYRATRRSGSMYEHARAVQAWYQKKPYT